ncbi:MAG: NAD-dependent epimerase/dehydratase family protein [Acidimicrobiales bacterium]|nr:NAD-dependent epimerase/dehydratase family protein [Acidimicrobiales bacterium]
MKVLVTGSSGLIGSQAVRFYDERGHDVVGVDNNMRAEFFGAGGDTTWNLEQLKQQTQRFRSVDIDIRDRGSLFALFADEQPDFIVHCAAQPSHDKAADIPLVDFDVNAVGTINMLEAARQHCAESPFVHMSTNKVYGDAPNDLDLIELETRFDYGDDAYANGIAEDFRIDQSLHSLFGASKAAADIVAQEYGRYFDMPVGIFRGGCLTGPAHSPVELHGFLAYLVKTAVGGGHYRIFGYKGKQVRDNIHSFDVLRAFEAYRSNPRPGEVYNLGGGRGNSVSMLEAFAKVEELTGQSIDFEYVDENRVGDHMCYISDLTKMREHFPGWDITLDLDAIFTELVEAAQRPE